MKDNYIPSIDNENKTVTPDGIVISNCTILDNGNISGYTSDGEKALYVSKDNKWVIGGKNIRQLNLINLRDRTKEERIQIGLKGSIKSKEAKEQKRNIQEVAKALLDSMMSDGVINQYIEHPEAMQGKTGADLLIHAMMEQAIKTGNYHAAEFVRDTAGYKPKNEVEIQADIMTESDRMLIDKVSKVG